MMPSSCRFFIDARSERASTAHFTAVGDLSVTANATTSASSKWYTSQKRVPENPARVAEHLTVRLWHQEHPHTYVPWRWQVFCIEQTPDDPPHCRPGCGVACDPEVVQCWEKRYAEPGPPRHGFGPSPISQAITASLSTAERCSNARACSGVSAPSGRSCRAGRSAGGSLELAGDRAGVAIPV